MLINFKRTDFEKLNKLRRNVPQLEKDQRSIIEIKKREEKRGKRQHDDKDVRSVST